MNITIDKTTLKKALDTLAPIIDRKPILPAYGCILIETFGETRLHLTVEGFNPFPRRVELYVDATVTTRGKMAVNLKALKALTAKCKKGTVTLQPTGDANRFLDEGPEKGGLEVLQNGLSRGVALVMSVDTFPPAKPIEGPAPICFTVDAHALQQAIENSAYAAASEDHRPILQGLYMGARKDEDTVTFAAADGYRLGIGYVPATLASKDGFQCVIPAHNTTLLGALLGTASPHMSVMVIVDTVNHRAVFNWGDVMMTVMLYEGRFPDFRPIPQDDEYHPFLSTVVIDPRAWLTALQPLEEYADEDANSIKLVFGDGMLTMSAKGYGESMVALLSLDNPHTAHVDYTLLKDALAHAGDCAQVSMTEHKFVFVPSAHMNTCSVVMGMIR